MDVRSGPAWRSYGPDNSNHFSSDNYKTKIAKLYPIITLFKVWSDI